MTAQVGQTALINQRAVCDYGAFWDIRMKDGSLIIETDDGPSLSTLKSVGPKVNDGRGHSVLVERLAGTIAAFIDGAAVGTAPSPAALRQLPPLVSHTDPCVSSDGTLPFAGSVADVCLTSL
jgi:Laminin G domain